MAKTQKADTLDQNPVLRITRNFDATPERVLTRGGGRPATQDELANFLGRLERELDACGFLHVPDMRPTMVRSIRNIFQRTRLMEHEVKTLHGILTGLTTGRDRDP